MSGVFIEFLKPLEDFNYKSQKLFKYCNKSHQYYISKTAPFKTPVIWSVSLCNDQNKVIYNSGGISAFAQHNNLSFEETKLLRKQLANIKTSTKQEAHQRAIRIFNLFSAKFKSPVDHNLQRKPAFNPFYLHYKNEAFIGSGCFTVIANPKNFASKQNKYTLKDKELENQLKLIGVETPQDFKSKPEIVRFFHQIISQHLSCLYHQHKSNSQPMYSDLWWRFFIKDNINLEEIFC